MLVLTRKIGEEIVIGHDIRVTVVDLGNGRVKLGIVAPKSVRVDRSEVREVRDAADAPHPPAVVVNRIAAIQAPVADTPVMVPPAAAPELPPSRLAAVRAKYARKPR